MDEPLIYASRVVRLPITDADGSTLGNVADIVLLPSIQRHAPAVLGFVAAIQRRRIFVAATRVGELDSSGLRLAGGTVDLRHFSLRPGELLVSQVLTRRVNGDVVTDLGLRPVARSE